MIDVEVTVDLSDVLETLARLHESIDTVDILDEAEAILLNRIRSRFLSEKDPEEVAWTPSEAALKRRAGKYTWSNGKKWTGTGTLFASGRLFHSIQAYANGPDSRSIGTDVPYAFRHNYGIGIIQRQFLGFSDADAFVIERRIHQRIQKALA